MTIRELYEPAMEILQQDEADVYFAHLVTMRMRGGCFSRQEAEHIERTNLGYFAGYYGYAVRRRVEKLFACEHPFFGSIERNGPPTADEAFAAGMRFGHAMLKR
jgi:hypothetical protein